MDRSSLDLGIWKRLKNLIRSLLPIDLFQIFSLNIYLRKALQSSSASFRRIVSFGRFSVERRCCMSLANSVTRATLCDESNPVLNPISLRKCFASTRILFTPSPKVRWWAVLLRKETKISTQPERTIFLHLYEQIRIATMNYQWSMTKSPSGVSRPRAVFTISIPERVTLISYFKQD